MQLLERAYPVVLVFCAGYLVATYRRNRRAAVYGMGGIALMAIWPVMHWHNTDLASLLSAAGWTDMVSRRLAEHWLSSALRAMCYALLIAAVLVDRRPPADPESD